MVSYWEYFVYNSKWGNHSGNATLLYYISISDCFIVYAFTCVRFYSFDNRYWLESYSLATSSWNSHPVYILRYIQSISSTISYTVLVWTLFPNV